MKSEKQIREMLEIRKQEKKDYESAKLYDLARGVDKQIEDIKFILERD